MNHFYEILFKREKLGIGSRKEFGNHQFSLFAQAKTLPKRLIPSVLMLFFFFPLVVNYLLNLQITVFE